MFRTYKRKCMTFLFIWITTFFLGSQLLLPSPVKAAPVLKSLSEPTLKLLTPLSKKVYGQATFSWESNVVLTPNQAFELILWEDNQDPMKDGFSPIGAGPEKIKSVDLDMAAETLHGLLNSARFYRWGVLLVEIQPHYRRLQYLGGGHKFYLELNGNVLPSGPRKSSGGQTQQPSNQNPGSNNGGSQTQQPSNQNPGSNNGGSQTQQPSNQNPGSNNGGGQTQQPSKPIIIIPVKPPGHFDNWDNPIPCQCYGDWPN